MLKSQKGFTLIELVIVIVILGILAAVAIPKYLDLATEAKGSACKGAMGGLYSSAGILLAAPGGVAPKLSVTGRGLPATRAEVITNTMKDGWTAVAAAGAGQIDVTLAGEVAVTCTTSNMLALGLTSD